jgi:putative ABC transport system permease protein
MIHDLRLALRALRRNAGYAALVIITLAFGIAGCTTVFSVLTAYLLRPLPFTDADRLVQIGQVDRVAGYDNARHSLPQYADLRERSRAFDDLAAYTYGSRNLTGDGTPIRTLATVVTGNMFALLGTPALRGRTITAADAGPGGNDVAVLSYAFWAGRYASDPAIVGRTMRLDGTTYTVIGVMPPAFTFPWNEVQLWLPTHENPVAAPRDATDWLVVGRLKRDGTRERAHAELLGIQRQLSALHPATDARYSGVTLRGMREALNFAYPVVRAGLTLLLTAVAALLLLACANVASLALARSAARTREIAVRQALGAGRGDLVRHLLLENGLLAVAGGAIGLGLAWAAVRVIGPALPDALFRVGTASIDGGALLFTLGMTLTTLLAFGVAPAISGSRVELAGAMKTGGDNGRTGTLRGRRGLVVTQVALAVLLIATASLMVRSFRAVQQVDLGFQTDRLMIAALRPARADYPGAVQRQAYFERAAAVVSALPGVASVGSADYVPLNHETDQVRYRPTANVPPDRWPLAITSRVSSGYFRTLGVPILAGRDFERGDLPEASPVVAVSRSLAEREWPNGDVLGRTLMIGAPDEARAATVVAVVGDVRWTDITSAVQPHIYRPLSQVPTSYRRLVIATDGRAAAGNRALQQALAGVDPNVPVSVRPMSEIVRENDFVWVISSLALGAFGLMALVLASLGIYGLIAHSVVRRRREIAIRMAVGATAREIRALMVGEAVRLATVGLGLGIIAALGAGRLLASLLYGVGPADGVTFLGVVALFAAVAALAALLPAQRAARVAPQRILRYE